MNLIHKALAGLSRLPLIGPDGPTMYRATIHVDGQGPIAFVYLTAPRLDQPVIIQNGTSFVLPADSMFVQTAKRFTEFQGREIPVLELELVAADQVNNTPDVIRPPEEFTGATIPRVKREKSEIADFVSV